MKKEEILSKITNEVLVSCQAYNDNPFNNADDMAKMAISAVLGGSIGIRCNSPENVSAIRKAVGDDIIIIGIWKIVEGDNPVYITTTMDAVDQLVSAGSQIIALDCTDRINAYGYKGFDLVKQIKEKYPDLVIMADCATFDEALKAKEVGVDIISSTLSGYTADTAYKKNDEPDFEMIKKMSEIDGVHLIAEGKIWTREEAIRAFEAGAKTLVIGSSITNPEYITRRFITATNKYFKGGK